MGQQTAKMAQASISFTSKKMLFLLAALVVAAYAQGPISTTCFDLKSSYQNNSCCSQDTGKAATFNGTNVTCGNVLSSYKSSECCSADGAKNATMIFPTNAPTNAPSSIPSSEPTSLPSNEATSMPSNEATSRPSDEATSMPSSEPTSIPSNGPVSCQAGATCGGAGTPLTLNTCDYHVHPDTRVQPS